MGKNSKAASGADAATSALLFWPEKLTLVMDKTHPLYDERVHLPIDESMVKNIMVHGVIQAITVRNNGKGEDGQPIIEVVTGRQRVKNCIEANRRLMKEGLEPHRVKALVVRAEQGTLMGVMISENEIRREDSLLGRSRKLARYLDTGKTEEEAAVTFGVTLPSIKNMLKYLELHPTVQKAIERDGLPANVAKELWGLPQEKQPAALEELVAAGTIKGARGVEAAKQVRRGKTADAQKVRMMSKNALTEWKAQLKKASGKDAELALAVVSRILGGERALVNYPRLRETLEAKES